MSKTGLNFLLWELSEVLKDRKDTNVLYEYLLLDVQSGSEMQTSRVANAIAAVQLYVERCLTNLEMGVDPSSTDGKLWEWMRSFRVWQENRKVAYFDEFSEVANLNLLGSYVHTEVNLFGNGTHQVVYTLPASVPKAATSVVISMWVRLVFEPNGTSTLVAYKSTDGSSFWSIYAVGGDGTSDDSFTGYTFKLSVKTPLNIGAPNVFVLSTNSASEWLYVTLCYTPNGSACKWSVHNNKQDTAEAVHRNTDAVSFSTFGGTLTFGGDNQRMSLSDFKVWHPISSNIGQTFGYQRNDSYFGNDLEYHLPFDTPALTATDATGKLKRKEATG